jgi:hypothetical protein
MDPKPRPNVKRVILAKLAITSSTGRDKQTLIQECIADYSFARSTIVQGIKALEKLDQVLVDNYGSIKITERGIDAL